MRALLLTSLVLAACGGEAPKGTDPVAAAAAAGARAAAELAVASGRCLCCHAADAATTARLSPLPVPPLRAVGCRNTQQSLARYLAGHFGGEDAATLAAFVQSLRPASKLQPAAVAGEAIARGGRLWNEFACRACHGADGIDGLERAADHAQVLAFLRAPGAARPGLVHDFALPPGDDAALAAWLLRKQRVEPEDAPPTPGLQADCFEMQIDTAALPALDGLEPQGRRIVTTIDPASRTRDSHFALRFTGTIHIPAAGEYTFVCGSDDASWLFLDDKLVVDNAMLAPHRRRDGKVKLTAGPHDLRVVFTEQEGEETLEVLWQGPGIEQQVLPASVLSVRTVTLVPPADQAPAAARRGAEQFVERRCGACHAGEAPAPVAPARPFAQLGDGPCAVVGAAAGVAAKARLAIATPRDERAALAFALQRDGCAACHVRDGQGGMPAEVRRTLVEVEDIGDEGRVPPDLTVVGRRLRPQWLHGVLTGERRARPYLRARMPRLPQDQAAAYVALFTALDAGPGDAQEPPFSAEAAAEGQRLAGTTGFNCITCHPFDGRRALGPQGMDLAVQHQRLQPAWFRDWLLHASKLRPGTRMPTLWWKGDTADRREVDALRSWLSLGSAAPTPLGFATNAGALVLDPLDRARLHGAFLKGLSARCLAVGTTARTHFAYDLEHCRLSWLWRGAFLDADGTWTGRAGKLLEPLGTDWVVLGGDCDFAPAGGDGKARLSGWRVGADGIPVFVLAVGAATVEDEVRPQLTDHGTVMRRRIAVTGAAVRLGLPRDGRVRAWVVEQEQKELVVPAGGSAEVVYRW